MHWQCVDQLAPLAEQAQRQRRVIFLHPGDKGDKVSTETYVRSWSAGDVLIGGGMLAGIRGLADGLDTEA
jgi:hypothetical protein